MFPARHNACAVGPLVAALLLFDQNARSWPQQDVPVAVYGSATGCLDAQVLAISGTWLAKPGARVLGQWSCLAAGDELIISGRQRTGEITVIYRRGSIPPHTEKCLTARDCRNAYTVERVIPQANPEPYIRTLIEEFFQKRQPKVVPGILQGAIRQPSPGDDLAGQYAPVGTSGSVAGTRAHLSPALVVIAAALASGAAVGAMEGAKSSTTPTPPPGTGGRAWVVGVVVGAAAVAIEATIIIVRHRRRNSPSRPRYSYIRPAVVCEQGGQVDLSPWWPATTTETKIKLTPLQPDVPESVSTLRWKLDKATDPPVLFEVLGTRATSEGTIQKSFVLVAPEGSCQISQKSYEDAGRFISSWPRDTPAAAVWNLQLGILADLAGLPKTILH